MKKTDLVHVVGLLFVTLVVENFLSASWDNSFVSGRAWFPGVAELVEALFFVAVFVPAGFVLVRLVETKNSARFAAWFGVAYGVLSLLLFRHSTTASNPLDVLFFYAKFAVPAWAAWLGAVISARMRSV
ncbi:MAG TPA: hypothetical protein VGD45_16875 [Steroidobacter sp.]|uniref:hypothetical protein n=1 Tax=Steroidobacter sp. TaxID=1978227 RepID=UPI002EDAB11A